MAGKRGLQQRMQAEIRKRRDKPRPQSVPTGNVRSDRWDEITRHHFDLLHDIEFALVDCWRLIEGIDDHWVHVGLVSTMRDDPPDHPTPYVVFARLKELRMQHDDLDAELWLDALRVVDQSVRDHSSLRHGHRSYLSFILAFLRADALESRPDYEIIEGRVKPPASSDSS